MIQRLYDNVYEKSRACLHVKEGQVGGVASHTALTQTSYSIIRHQHELKRDDASTLGPTLDMLWVLCYCLSGCCAGVDAAAGAGLAGAAHVLTGMVDMLR